MTFNALNGQGAQALDINQLLDILANDIIVSNCSPSAGSNDLEIDVNSGSAWVNGSVVSVSSGTVTLSTGDSEPRKDLIYIDSNGNIQSSEGTAESSEPSSNTRFKTFKPAPNDSTNIDGAIVAEVWVGANKSDTFSSSDIRDRRILASNLDAILNTLKVRGDISDDNSTTIWDYTNSHVPNSSVSALTNFSAGNTFNSYPISVGNDTDNDLDGSDLVDDNTTVYDSSTTTIGNGSTTADHTDVNTNKLSCQIEDPQDVKGSRSTNTEYQNNNDYILIVSVTFESDGTQTISVFPSVGNTSGSLVIKGTTEIDKADISKRTNLTLPNFIVPPNGYYKIGTGASHDATVRDWNERGWT